MFPMLHAMPASATGCLQRLRRLAVAGLLLASLPALAAEGGAAINEAEMLMERSWHATLLPGAVSRATFTLISESGRTQQRKVTSYMKLQPGKTDNRRMTRFDYPADARGIATLLVDHAGADDELWLYIPAAKKVRRVVASDKKKSFMGTDLSYGDVIGHRVAAWSHKLGGDDAVDGRKCRLVESLPRTDTVRDESGYARRLSCIDPETFVALRTEFWDVDGKPLKTVWNRAVEAVAGHPGLYVARQIEARDLQSGHSTRISIDEFKPTTDIPEAQFAARALEE